jgi:hypothetical protein
MRPSRLSLNRRRSGAVVLAIIAILALVRLRSTGESYPVLALDISLNACLVLATAWLASQAAGSQRNSRSGAAKRIRYTPQAWIAIGTSLSICFPLLANQVERGAGHGTGRELALMGALAWGGLVAALFAKWNRTLSISVVCSGFLTLFTTVSSDHQSAVFIAYVWGVVCLWWLIANHWERVEACQIDTVRSRSLRIPLALVAGSLVFVVAAWSASGRSAMFNRLQAELMPTSGGSGVHDASARSGVGDGDTVVAAREHATSFGAVESDVFLDSPQPSLFDMFNESFGEPVSKKTERAIALAPRETPATTDRTAQSSSSTQSFTTRRSEPKPRKPLKDVASKATMYWIGRAGERLSTQRYSRFDGVEWHAEESAWKPPIHEHKIGERVWFAADANHGLEMGPYVDTRAEAIQFTRFRSNRIPAPAGLQMWQIDLVDKADFFGITADRCLEMPGREHVPDHTTVRLVNRLIDLEKLESLTSSFPGVPPGLYPSAADLREDQGVQLARQMVLEWVPHPQHRWEHVQIVVDRLRREFTFDRSVATGSTIDANPAVKPLESFLRERRGNAVMFATAASVMLREIGFGTRLVSGFYIDPHNLNRLTGQIAITPADAHAWVEVDVGMDIWIPIEPTPGFLPPVYRVSWWYRVKQRAWAFAGTCAALVLLAAAIWLSRAYVFEGGCRVLRWGLPCVDDRRRVRWLVRILDRRCRLAGMARPQWISPRQWLTQNVALEKAEWAGSLARFFNEADGLNFGSKSSLTSEGRRACAQLWLEASTFCFRRLRPTH